MPMTESQPNQRVWTDFISGLVVFLVALPLCLGVALASGAPAMSGVIAGIVGGIVVGLLSGSQTSVSGPAAGLTAIVLAQIKSLGAFETFLVAVFLAGVIQIGMGLLRGGFIAAFFPSSVIKGLLSAIGLILILKQLPHLVGHDPDPEDDMSFIQPDNENTFSELVKTVGDIQFGAAVVGLSCLVLLFLWDRIPKLKKSIVPAPLIVVLIGIGASYSFEVLGGVWNIETSHRVDVPVLDSIKNIGSMLKFPNFDAIGQKAVWIAAFTIAIVASLETLLNLEAVDKIDPKRRKSPASRELLAQGVGNIVCGSIGGLPVTSVIVRSSVNIAAGAKTKMSAIVHGVLLAVCVLVIPVLLNRIPLACLAAILIHTGVKLASPKVFKSVWKQGFSQFLPFVVTVLVILFTDLLVGILVGLFVSVAFILRSNLRRPLTIVQEKHVSGAVMHVMLANQVSFLNKAKFANLLDESPGVTDILLDARDTDYIDPDILDLIVTLRDEVGPARGVKISLVGFKDQYQLEDHIQFIDYTSRELRDSLTPDRVLQILKDGHERFVKGLRLSRDLNRQVSATAEKQTPMAVILSCIDSRAPVEMIFDVGLGDIFTIRIAGNVAKDKVLGSMEYACVVAGAKLVLVMGHTRCGAVTASVDLKVSGRDVSDATGCHHLETLVTEIQQAIDVGTMGEFASLPPESKEAYVDNVAEKNVKRTMEVIRTRSEVLAQSERDGKIKIVGALYDVKTGGIRFFGDGLG